MTIADVLRPGSKIDIKLLNQSGDKVYKSSIYNYVSATDMEITMPTDDGKMVMFQNGTVCEFLFYTQSGLYTCDAAVRGRYKKEGFYLTLVKVISVPKKFQRREYFRISYLYDFIYFKITKEVAQLDRTFDLMKESKKVEYITEERTGTLKDLSGGGIRFIAEEELEVDSYILSILQVSAEKTFYLVTRIIACELKEDSKRKYVVRAKFEHKEREEQEELIRFVFEEDRRIRKKENG